MQRRSLINTAAALIAGAALPAWAQTPTTLPVLQVWKDPNCGCCQDWVNHLQADGFQVQVFATGNAAVRKRLGLPDKFASCHTGLIGGYAIEGHVNAREIRRLLAEKPKAIGLAVPGMPVGSPGMDGAVYGDRRDAYDVVLVQPDGTGRVYQHYTGNTTGFKRTATTADTLSMVEAEVRRVDTAAGKISLKHGEIKNLDMPPMTMVFQVNDPALLGKVKAGDKVRFTAMQINGAYTVMSIEPMP
ncbi:copper-binding protein [Hydrogenophaga sp. Root209]|uniref:copper-binding protein n=1 Tax=Hydrogenophaga sp. Root209 TaxID=1736490 RepID=UPI000AFF1317|nr:copper-binding protein [Hydrogenophaga sp. Root209]